MENQYYRPLHRATAPTKFRLDLTPTPWFHSKTWVGIEIFLAKKSDWVQPCLRWVGKSPTSFYCVIHWVGNSKRLKLAVWFIGLICRLVLNMEKKPAPPYRQRTLFQRVCPGQTVLNHPLAPASQPYPFPKFLPSRTAWAQRIYRLPASNLHF